ncbi:type III-B CRISPR module-associated protein Cmr5 [bacterium]|nr:type III-B CRISPR module-associated protein Cmr5 [candidate division CSSED10-310 bacterium]
MAEKSIIKDIEQKRSQQAYLFVESVVKHDQWDKYKSGVRKLPFYIKTNGLGQSLAFIKKRDDGWDILYKQLSTWLQTEDVKQLVPKGELVKEVINMNSETYRQVTVETLALLNWMRRFVDGFDTK